MESVEQVLVVVVPAELTIRMVTEAPFTAVPLVLRTILTRAIAL